MVAKGASHCGSGCCIGDIAAEWLAFLVPSVAVWFGWMMQIAMVCGILTSYPVNWWLLKTGVQEKM